MNEELNQTQFGAEEPVFESIPPEMAEVNPEQVQKQSKTRKLILAGVVFIFILMTALIIIVISSGSRNGTPQLGGNPSPTPKAEVGPRQAELNTIKSELEQADPSRSYLPKPPVDMTIRLEKKY